MNFIGIFGQYDFAIRDAMVLCLVALAVYLLLNAGIFAVPQVGLMAIGSYVSAMASVNLGLPFLLALLLGALAAMAAGMVLALLLGRLNGIYLAIATIAFSEIVGASVLIIPGTGGAQGLVSIPRAANDLYIAGILLLAIVAIVVINKSKFGLAIVAMREDRLMASHQGINIFVYRLWLFSFAGFLSGLAGALSAHMSGFVEPSMFSFDLLTQLISMVVLGGMTYVMGPVIGAVIVLGLPHLYTSLNDYQLLFNGLLIVLVVSFAPRGIIGAVVVLWSEMGKSTRMGKSLAAGSLSAVGPIEYPAQPAAANQRVNGSAVVKLSEITMSFGGNTALDQASLEVGAGEILGLIGPNGSGKTTMLNVISGIYRPQQGTGQLLGKDISALWGHPHKLSRCGIARTFQTIRLIDDYSVLENVMIGMSHTGASQPGGDGGHVSREATARAVLARLGLLEIEQVKAGWLPYGVRRKVEIARAVVSNPSILLLDEPTAGMNAEETAEIFRTVSLLRDSGMAVVIVEHDVDMMAANCDRLVVLNFGSVLASGEPAEVLKNREVVTAYVGGTA